MKTLLLSLLPCLCLATACTPRDGVESVSLTLLNKPVIAVTVENGHITIPVGVSAYVAFDVQGKNGSYTGAYVVVPSNPQIIGVQRDTADETPSGAESCVSPTADGVVTKYLVYGASVGQTNLHIIPTTACSRDGDDGQVNIDVDVVDQVTP